VQVIEELGDEATAAAVLAAVPGLWDIAVLRQQLRNITSFTPEPVEYILNKPELIYCLLPFTHRSRGDRGP
jgi:hypothetical protein